MPNRIITYLQDAPTVETRDGGGHTIKGYAAVFYDENNSDMTQYMMGEMCAERIFPGAFDRCLREKQDVRALFNHDSGMLLGRTGNNTLRMAVDSKGLAYMIDPPNTQVGNDVVTYLQRGDVSGSSFSFSLATNDDMGAEARSTVNPVS
jgi:HK97 family phage prohead protease